MDRVLEAFRSCISEPKCRDCPWTECEELGNKKVKIPADLALAVNRLLNTLPKDQKPETDREKTVKGLKCCTSYDACNECPYEIYKDKFASVCMFKMMESALALLKEQEPRVMTLEEVKAFGWDYCYLEEERLPGKEYRMVCGDYALTCITWPCVASMRIQHGDNDYGKKWRCWSAKPTDEQRQAAKWNA